MSLVAPARERGLKYHLGGNQSCATSRSREGAWIEIRASSLLVSITAGRSREGAWIEITS